MTSKIIHVTYSFHGEWHEFMWHTHETPCHCSIIVFVTLDHYASIFISIRICVLHFAIESVPTIRLHARCDSPCSLCNISRCTSVSIYIYTSTWAQQTITATFICTLYMNDERSVVYAHGIRWIYGNDEPWSGNLYMLVCCVHTLCHCAAIRTWTLEGKTIR